MDKIDRINDIWSAVYDPQADTTAVIEQYFHPDYEQCINGVSILRPEYIYHVIAQKKTMQVNHINYLHHLENKDELFAIYELKGKTTAGSDIEAEVIGYFQFQDDQLIKIHGQVRLMKGSYSDTDMHDR